MSAPRNLDPLASFRAVITGDPQSTINGPLLAAARRQWRRAQHRKQR
ncbi:MAG: hypothetical protein P8173_07960 [Gammaproteobacteria bacterium]